MEIPKEHIQLTESNLETENEILNVRPPNLENIDLHIFEIANSRNLEKAASSSRMDFRKNTVVEKVDWVTEICSVLNEQLCCRKVSILGNVQEHSGPHIFQVPEILS